MRLYEFSTDDITFDIDYNDYRSGQHYAELIATQHNTEIGRIDFSVYQEIPAIHYIDSKTKRTGLATKMLQFLQSKFPDEEIDFGGLTDDGANLYKSLRFKELPNTTYDFSEYDDLLKQKEELSKQIKEYDIDPDNLDWDKLSTKEIDVVANLLNDYSDLEYDLEKEVYYQASHKIKRTKKIII